MDKDDLKIVKEFVSNAKGNLASIMNMVKSGRFKDAYKEIIIAHDNLEGIQVMISGFIPETEIDCGEDEIETGEEDI